MASHPEPARFMAATLTSKHLTSDQCININSQLWSSGCHQVASHPELTSLMAVVTENGHLGVLVLRIHDVLGISMYAGI